MRETSLHQSNIVALLRCPICKAAFCLRENSLVCANAHCFDIAAKGYVNFLPGQRRERYSRELFESRQTVFAGGFYEPLVAALITLLNETGQTHLRLLDAGAGEGYYTAKLTERLGGCLTAFALDIEKEAIALAARSKSEVALLVGDIANMPVLDNSMDVVLNILSPANYAEFSRVLKPGGVLLKVVPAEGYLRELRACAGEQLKSEGHTPETVETHFANSSFIFRGKTEIRNVFSVTPEDILHFSRMTPLLSHIDKNGLDISSIANITLNLDVLCGVKKGERDQT